MATKYVVQNFGDIVNAVLEELGASSSDTKMINRIKRDINFVYLQEVVPAEDWYWLSETVEVQAQAYFNTGTASVTANDPSVTLTESPAISYKGYLFSVDGYNEVYRIASHSADSGSITLESPFTGDTNSSVSFRIWADTLPLPPDCMRTTAVRHSFQEKPLDARGQRDFRKLVSQAPKSSARPTYYSTGGLVDPEPFESISSIPASATRSASGLTRTIVFDATLGGDEDSSLLRPGDKIEVTGAGSDTYNGEVTVSELTTTTVTNDTIKYVVNEPLNESSTADTGMTVKRASTEGAYSRYRQLFIHPALFDARTTLYVDYQRRPEALIDDADEPEMPIEDRSVLVYGVLSRQWVKARDEDTATLNEAQYRNKIIKMAGRIEDTLDLPKVEINRSYMSAKRRQGRGRGMASAIASGFGTGGGATEISGTASRAAIFNSSGKLVSSDSITLTELGYLDGVTSSVQTQLDDKIDDIASSTDNAVARWSGADGDTLQDSNVLINDADAVSGVTELDVDNVNVNGNTISSTDTDGDLNLTPNGSGTTKIKNPETSTGVDLVDLSSAQTLTNKTVDADNNTISNLAHGAEVDNPSSGVHGVTGSVVGTSDTQTLTNKTIDGDTNTISNLAHGSEVDNPSSGVHGVTGSVVGTTDTQTLTNKSIDSDNNTITNIVDADIKSSAAIARSKVASGTADHVVTNDGTGVFSSEAQLAISRGGTGQSTASAGFDALAPTTTKGDLTAYSTTNARLPVGSDGDVLTADSAETTGIKWSAPASAPEHVYQLSNVGISASASAGALTAALEQSDGSTDPTSGSPAKIAFRSTTLTSGAFTLEEYTSATSVTIPSGATLGYSDGDDNTVYVYAIYDGTNKEIAVSGFRFNEEELHDTTAIGTGSDDKYTLYSTSARTSCAIRLIGVVYIEDMTTAGTWTAPDRVYAAPGPAQIAASEKVVAIAKLSGSSANLTISDSTAGEIIDYDDVVEDTYNAITTGASWVFTAPMAGEYRVSSFHQVNTASAATVNKYFQIRLEVDGSDDKLLDKFIYQTTSTINAVVSGSTTVKLSKDQTIAVEAYQTTGGSVTLATGNFGHIAIERIGGTQ